MRELCGASIGLHPTLLGSIYFFCENTLVHLFVSCPSPDFYTLQTAHGFSLLLTNKLTYRSSFLADRQQSHVARYSFPFSFPPSELSDVVEIDITRRSELTNAHSDNVIVLLYKMRNLAEELLFRSTYLLTN